MPYLGDKDSLISICFQRLFDKEHSNATRLSGRLSVALSRAIREAHLIAGDDYRQLQLTFELALEFCPIKANSLRTVRRGMPTDSSSSDRSLPRRTAILVRRFLQLTHTQVKVNKLIKSVLFLHFNRFERPGRATSATARRLKPDRP